MSNIFEQNKQAVQEIKDYEKAPITVTKRNLLMVGGGVALVGTASMFASAILTGVAALATTAIIIPVGYYGYRLIKNADPYIKQKIKNESLKLMYKEAAKNAIYQLDNDVIQKKDKIKLAMKKRDEIGGQLKSLETDLEKTKKDPDLVDSVPTLQKMYDAVDSAYSLIVEQIAASQDAFKKYEKEVKIYKHKQKFADSAEEIMLAINAETSIADQLTLVAMESIDTSFNTSMAAIENITADKSKGF